MNKSWSQACLQLNIQYEHNYHQPLYTMADVEALENKLLYCKNILLKNEKKEIFFCIVSGFKKVDMKQLQQYLGCKKLSFVNAEEILQCEKGNLSPCYLTLENNYITVLFDESLTKQQHIAIHPCRNDETIILLVTDLYRILTYFNFTIKNIPM